MYTYSHTHTLLPHMQHNQKGFIFNDAAHTSCCILICLSCEGFVTQIKFLLFAVFHFFFFVFLFFYFLYIECQFKCGKFQIYSKLEGKSFNLQRPIFTDIHTIQQHLKQAAAAAAITAVAAATLVAMSLPPRQKSTIEI